MFNLNQKGQEFTVFKYLIAAVIGIAVISIVYTMIGNSQRLATLPTRNAIHSVVKDAIQAAGIEPVRRDNLIFDQGFGVSITELENATGRKGAFMLYCSSQFDKTTGNTGQTMLCMAKTKVRTFVQVYCSDSTHCDVCIGTNNCT